MVRECQVCGLDKKICTEVRRGMAYGRCFAIFLIMEAVFGSAITFAALARSYTALSLFAYLSVMSIVLVARKPW